MEKAILNISRISKSYEGLHLFSDVSLELYLGSINSLFGGNGTGKTTFFNLIAGYDTPNSGNIFFNGENITNNNPITISQAGLGKMWQTPRMFLNHTLIDNLILASKFPRGESLFNHFFNIKSIVREEKKINEKAMNLLCEVGMQDKKDDLAGNLSLGQSKLFSLTMLMMNDAQLYLLDEPFSNINPKTIEQISKHLLRLKERGKSVFMIEHKIPFAKRISDNCYSIQSHKINKI